jgi:hypothetical protein
MTDKPTDALERAEELLVSQARLSFDPSRVAIRRDDLRVLVRLANAMHQASDTGDDDALVERLLRHIESLEVHGAGNTERLSFDDLVAIADRLQAKGEG